MKKSLLIAGGVVAAIALIKNKKDLATFVDKWSVLTRFIPEVEGFVSKPFWDYKQWSWGYGTAAGFNKAVKPAGTITKAQAAIDSVNHLRKDYEVLKPLVKRDLTGSQWAALLSFSYNAGVGNAKKLVPNINNDLLAFEKQFLSYNKVKSASGAYEVHQGLVTRRAKELRLWNS